MRKRTHEKKSVLSVGKRMLVGALAASLVFSGSAWAGMNNIFSTADEETAVEGAYRLGDVNGDGEIKLDDAQLALQFALGIGNPDENEANAGNVDDSTEGITLEDAKAILLVALGINPDPTPTPTPTPEFRPITPTPPPPPTTQTPKPTLTPVSGSAASVVTGQTLAVAEDNSEYSTTVDENYEGYEGMYGFHANVSGNETYGLKVVNPMAGDYSLRENVVSATSVEAEEGKKVCWSLTGASLEPLPPKSVYPPEIDTRLTTDFSPASVTYTRPDWERGATFSFWAKLDSTVNGADPLMVVKDENFIFMFRANGSVLLKDSTDSLNRFEMGSKSIEPLGVMGEWNYYTITIANDWIQVYVNGQENLYDGSTHLSRGEITTFNGGFLTRVHPYGPVNQEMVDNAPERENFYWTKDDATSSIQRVRKLWYLSEELGMWTSDDDFYVFGTARLRGADGNGRLLMDLLTRKTAELWIGGTVTDLEADKTAYRFNGGAIVSELTYYPQELTAEQIASNYRYGTVKPSEDIPMPTEIVPTPTPSPTPTPEPTTPPPSDKPVSGIAVEIKTSNSYLGENATYDAETGVFTFKSATPDEEGEVYGARVVNPFMSTKSDDKSRLISTLEKALEGQDIFPYRWPDDYEGVDPVLGTPLAGEFIARDKNGLGGGCDRWAVSMLYGNHYDVYYGDPYLYGTQMSTPTSNGIDKIMTEDEIKAAYGDQITTYQRPVWSNGMSISFWAKPTVVDDSPLLTFYAANKMLCYIDTMGSVCYMSLYDAENNAGDWKTGKVMKAGGEPRNSFSTYGDESYVTANEWNYYTITFANDWIQVYVNGVEMVYKVANLNRGECKYFNQGYLTRYNTIGIWTNEMVEKYGDPSGATLEGTERNYLTKSTYVWDMSAGLEVAGVNKAADSASLRSANAYEDPYVRKDRMLLVDLMTSSNSKMYIGGVPGALQATEKFVFSDLKIDYSELDKTNIHMLPVAYVQASIVDKDLVAVWVDKEVQVVTADTEGAYRLTNIDGSELVDETGNPIYVSEQCNRVEVGTVGAFAITKDAEPKVETSTSRNKIYSSDHTLAEGTQVTDIQYYELELTATQVKANYEIETTPGAVEVQ